MLKKKSIRSIRRFVTNLKDDEQFRIGLEVTDDILDILQNIGFPERIENGLSIIPKPVGKYTQFNAHGLEIVRKDLPKETVYRMVYATWKDWHGYPHSGFQHRAYKAYPRELIPAPSTSLIIVSKNNKFYVVSEILKNSTQDEDYNLHVFNLFLEIFGQFDIFSHNTEKIQNPKIKRVNWEVLPKGEYPWEKAQEYVNKVTEQLDKDRRIVIEERIKRITRYNPDFVAIGKGGFNGYIVLGFESKKLYVFESIHLGNATYVFNKDWESISMLTKSEIISNDLYFKRIIHKSSWYREIANLLR